MIVMPKEMLLSFSIGTFLSNYDITIRKQQKGLIYSIVQKSTFWEQKQVNGNYLNKAHTWYISLNLRHPAERHVCDITMCAVRELSVKRKDLWALTLVGLTRENPELDPLAVQHLGNRLYMNI